MTFAKVAASLIALALFLVLLVRGINRKKEDDDVKNVIDILSKNEVYTIRMFSFEQYIVDKLKLPRERVRLFVYMLRIVIMCLFVFSYFAFGTAGVAIFIAIGILFTMENKKKYEIEKSGITRIADTVAFMDFFTPQIASGASAEQAFIRYIEKLDDKNEYRRLLLEYLDAKKNQDYSYKAPTMIKDIVSVYENAVYNEEMGSSNYLYIIKEAKADLFQKSVYYTDYNSRVSEVLKPIEFAYYIGVPFIIFILFGSIGNFWFTIYGVITSFALLVLFYAFKALCNRLAIKTLHEIVG